MVATVDIGMAEPARLVIRLPDRGAAYLSYPVDRSDSSIWEVAPTLLWDNGQAWLSDLTPDLRIATFTATAAQVALVRECRIVSLVEMDPTNGSVTRVYATAGMPSWFRADPRPQ